MCIKFSYIHVLKFCCYDLNHSFPGQVRFYCFPFINHFLTHIVMPWSFFKEFSSACNWKQNFQFSFLETQNTFFVIATSFCIGWNHGSEFHEFKLLEKKKTEFSIHICRSLPLMHLATSMLTWHNWSKSISQWILTVLMAKKNRKKSDLLMFWLTSNHKNMVFFASHSKCSLFFFDKRLDA